MTLFVRNPDDLPALLAESDDTKSIDILGRGKAVTLPLVPASVEAISLSCLNLVGPVAFAEGLVELYVNNVTTETPLSEWQWPETLEYLSISTSLESPMDLSSLRVDTLFILFRRQVPEVFLIPEKLRRLIFAIAEMTVLPPLPSDLRELSLTGDNKLRDCSAARSIPIEVLVTDQALDLGKDFPHLRELAFVNCSRQVSKISFTRLETLRFDNCTIPTTVEINAPKLRELSIERSPSITLSGTFGETVTALTLSDSSTFPRVDDWESLEVVAIEGRGWTPIDLPYIRWLRELTADRPMTTNGVSIKSIDEYRVAWGIQQKKSARR